MSHFNGISKLAFGALLVFLVSCGTGHDADEKYFLISTNVKIPYWQAGSAGLFQAAQQLKVRSEFAGPDSYDPKAEQKAFQQAVQSKPTGILVSVADPSLMKDDIVFFFKQKTAYEIRTVTGVQTCALPIWINIPIYIENIVVKTSIIMALLIRHYAHYAS